MHNLIFEGLKILIISGITHQQSNGETLLFCLSSINCFTYLHLDVRLIIVRPLVMFSDIGMYYVGLLL